MFERNLMRIKREATEKYFVSRKIGKLKVFKKRFLGTENIVEYGEKMFEDVAPRNRTSYKQIFYSIADYLSRKASDLTWGQELEIPTERENEWILQLAQIIHGSGGAHYDGSGPLEFMYGIQGTNDTLFVSFLSVLISGKEINIYPSEQMGNHVHVRPQDFSNLIKVSTAFILPMLPLLSSHVSSTGNKYYYFRTSIWDWTSDFDEIIYYIRNIKDKQFGNIVRNYRGRMYSMFTLNRHRKQTLTVEYRVSEALPIKAYTFIQLLYYLYKNAEIVFSKNINDDDIANEIYDMRDEYAKALDTGITLDYKFKTPKIFKVHINDMEVTEITPKQLLILLNNSNDVFVKAVAKSMLNDGEVEPISSETTYQFIKNNPAVQEKIIEDLKFIKNNLIPSS